MMCHLHTHDCCIFLFNIYKSGFSSILLSAVRDQANSKICAYIMNFPTNHRNIYSNAGFSLLEGNISRCWLIATYSSRSRSKYMYIWCGLALLCTYVETARSLYIPVACEMLCTPLINEWLGDTKCFQPTDWLIWCYNCEVICQLLSQILVNLKRQHWQRLRNEGQKLTDLQI